VLLAEVQVQSGGDEPGSAAGPNVHVVKGVSVKGESLAFFPQAAAEVGIVRFFGSF
jgi:hypothetical protein